MSEQNQEDLVSELELNQYIAARVKKLETIQAAGINPYPSGPFLKEAIADVIGRPLGEQAKIAGRIMRERVMGSIAFFELKDESGQMQVVLSKKDLAESLPGVDFDFWTANLDLGDIIGVSGERFDTKTGERSVKIKELILLSKSLRPLPDKFKGLRDEETKLRKRYLDILYNAETRDLIYQKDKFWNSTRQFLKNHGFIEVYTPVLEITTGGGDARPFKTHHNALDMEVYLRISNGELWQKRLMVAGLEKTFEIGRQFRNEGMSAEHLQEYDQMEFYWAYANYELGMNLVRDLFRHVARETFGTETFVMNRHGARFEINLAKPWERYDFNETISNLTGINAATAKLEDLVRKLDSLKAHYDPKGINRARALDALWKWCRVKIAGPGFLINEPLELSPLAKRKAGVPGIVERFHVIIAGSELGNGYSELNDPIDQRARFDEQQRLRDAGDEEAQMSDLDFVEALEYGMPPTCGFGMSERVFAYMTDRTVRECQTFPLMRPI
ncbi:MAG TPA: lysine--tRNA ligase [Oligoflexia bacterium]|nr:lysine--tRNA ligase [Oligoflexia bacterium]HMP26431.1 lysine--tRNA ligase [Oligoflexia bacterium]